MQPAVNIIKVGVCEAKAYAVDGVEKVKNIVVKFRGKIEKGEILAGQGLAWAWGLIIHHRV